MRREDRADLALAIALALAGVVEVVVQTDHRGALWLDILLTALVCLPVAARRDAPLPALVAAMTAAVISQAALTPIASRVVPLLVVIGLSYSVARFDPTRPAVLGLLIALGCVTAISVLDDPSFENILFPDVFFVWVPWLAGRTLRHRTGLARALSERTERLEREREEAAERGVRAERRRIARELHDVVAHSVSVMVVQAGAGRRVAEQDPERAAECAALIERVGREALGELRRLLGMMREESGESGAALAPQPSLSRLGELVQNAREAGLPVEVDTSGTPGSLPAGVDLAAYRIVQEALTNTLKHAGPARARVFVTYGPDALELEVTDDGRGPGELHSAGHGIIGMRERAALCGGDLTCGGRDDGGWVVHARLPLAEAPAAGVPAGVAG
jgi:signal transduction histidine kinase